jgi:hypothetical protein
VRINLVDFVLGIVIWSRLIFRRTWFHHFVRIWSRNRRRRRSGERTTSSGHKVIIYEHERD